MPNIEKSILQKITFSEITQKNSTLYIKRDDLIHSKISGNKYRKLKYNIAQAKIENKNTFLTFGGAFSNHISAVALAGKLYSFKTIGIIRGEELGANLEKTLANNTTLKFAYDCGMQFKFVSRSVYREKTSKEFIEKLKDEFEDFYLIPEGGTNELAVKGCAEILNFETSYFDIICLAVGTGGTIAGLINAAQDHQQIIGFPVLKGNFLTSEIKKYTKKTSNWSLNTDYHFGGYAKNSVALIDFINRFKKETSIQLDPIYTGKMMFGVVDLMNKNYIADGSKILVIHTGGIQGIEGINAILRKKGSLTIDIKNK